MAIARDTFATASAVSATSQTTSVTVATATPVLCIGVRGSADTDNITSVTFNSVAATLVDKFQAGTSSWSYLYYVGGQSGTHDIVVTNSGVGDLNIQTYYLSLTGANTIADATHKTTAVTTTSVTDSITTVADNCWVVGFAVSQGFTMTADTGANSVTVDSNGYGIYDSNGPKTPAGARSMKVAISGSTNLGLIEASFSPSTSQTINDVVTVVDSLIGDISATLTDITTVLDSILNVDWVNKARTTQGSTTNLARSIAGSTTNMAKSSEGSTTNLPRS